jgi:predicted acylesterase/phospholipase RssA
MRSLSSTAARNESPFANVVFAGGGNRCLWQAGFYRTLADAIVLTPSRAAAASAGAAIASVLFAGRVDAALALFKRATTVNRRNVYAANLFNGAPVFPHAAIYRNTLLEIIDATALAALRAGPRLSVPITRVPAWLGARSGFIVAGIAGVVDSAFGGPVHARFAPKLGFTVDYVAANACRTPVELADLVLASSCTPPFTPLLRHGGKPALDGGIADNVPIAALDDATGVTLVLLTRRYRELPTRAAHVYVQPSTNVPIATWDYTNPAGLQAAYDLGRRDGERFVADSSIG